MINYEAFFSVTYGLYIVSSGNENKGNAFISNAATQVTSEPPQFAVCCNKDNYTADIIKLSRNFVLSVLQQSASPLVIGKFGYKSGRDINKMEGTKIIYGETGAPVILDDVLAYIECKLVNAFDVGTHIIFIGEALNAEILSAEEPLTYAYYRKVKKGFSPKNAPTYIDKSKLEKSAKPSYEKYRCPACGYIYNPAIGDETAHIKPGTLFKDLPDYWKCPVCGVDNLDFVKV
ncbi:MAG: flavin reductase [Bacteroidales bacterium]|nr:flavin reductase [Bacteroidales bacterium]